MRQSFEDKSDPARGPRHVALLRAELKRRGLDGYLVPRADEHQGEYLPASAERLYWLTGFSGSAGNVAVLADRAAVFVDGRYTVQARQQLDPATFVIQKVPESRLGTWLAEEAPGRRIGYDPRLHTLAEIEALEKATAGKGTVLVALEDNLVDAVWTDRPAPPVGAVAPQPLELAGRPPEAKIAELQQAMRQAGEDAMLLTLPDSIAWLLNIRGSDVPYTPFPLSFAVVPAEGQPELFIDPRKLGANVRGQVSASARLSGPEALLPALVGLGARRAKVRVDPDTAGKWYADRLAAAGAQVSRGSDPCQLAKARKTPAELAGARAAQLRDAVPLARFLAWLDREAPQGRLDEIACAEQLERLRAGTGELKDLSFDSISAAGEHAALPHYRVSRNSNLRLAPDSLYLIDSGGQYQDGTTDVTRTIAVGVPPGEARQRFTLVLKGMIAVSVARFPKGTRGCDLDPFARRALWAAGLDFDHGTGHGVGSYLSVHEGPQRLAKTGVTPLEPGMILSNEPGYYKEGAYGIRIENLLVVTEPAQVPGGERPMLGFETLTLAPIDRRLIDTALLSGEEIAWLDDYHARVLGEVGPLLEAADRAWLEEATAPLGHTGPNRRKPAGKSPGKSGAKRGSRTS